MKCTMKQYLIMKILIGCFKDLKFYVTTDVSGTQGSAEVGGVECVTPHHFLPKLSVNHWALR